MPTRNLPFLLCPLQDTSFTDTRHGKRCVRISSSMEDGSRGAHNEVEQTQKQRMLRGELYNGFDPELVGERHYAEVQLLRLNTSTDFDERAALMRVFLGSFGPGSFIRPSFFCDYGYNIFLGANVFLNCNCVLLDVMPIHIGDGTQIGPAVQIYTADHPRDRETRLAGLEFGRPVTVGRNVWIGGGAILLPGVSVGDDVVIGAGSVVTRNVAAGTTVVGNPAKPLPRHQETSANL